MKVLPIRGIRGVFSLWLWQGAPF